MVKSSQFAIVKIYWNLGFDRFGIMFRKCSESPKLDDSIHILAGEILIHVKKSEFCC